MIQDLNDKEIDTAKRTFLSSITIRPYDAQKDHQSIKDILSNRELAPYLESEEMTIGEYLFYIQPTQKLTGYAISLDGVVVGVRTFYVTPPALRFNGADEDSISMSSLIDPNYQGKGIGRQAFALTTFDFLCKRPEVEALHARSEISNSAANHIIRNMGLTYVGQEIYEDTGAIDNCYRGSREDILRVITAFVQNMQPLSVTGLPNRPQIKTARDAQDFMI